MNIYRYSADRQHEWDEFVKVSKNGTFLFLRTYMDYHQDRFTDHSLMFYDGKGELTALLPANQTGLSLFSHQGLTYGGFVLSKKIHITEVGEILQLTLSYLRKHGFKQFFYKQMPSIYHLQPSQEDTYWLWRNEAEMIGCNLMTAINLHDDNAIISSRKRTYYNKLQREGYTIEMNAPLSVFWPILENNLQEKFEAKPVHTLQEITLLQKSFPQNILCCTIQNPQGNVVAGTVLFISQQIVRTQYISATHEGKQCNALDFLMLSLIKYYRSLPQYLYFEFGTSMAKDGINLNEGLIRQKEGFGGRSIACCTYKITL